MISHLKEKKEKKSCALGEKNKTKTSGDKH